DGIILVHGGGTHGHRTMKRWEAGAIRGTEQRKIWEVKWRMLQLTETIVRILGENGVPAVSVSPSDIIRLSGRSIASFETGSILDILKSGCVPLLRGDLVPDIDGHWSVVSGDDMMVELVRKGREGKLPVTDTAIMCFDLNGFYRNFGKKEQELIDEIGPDEYHTDFQTWKDQSYNINGQRDATGGILGKVRSCHRIAALGCNVWLAGGPLERSLGPVLSGEGAGTLFRAFEGKKECIEGTCKTRMVDRE
ncbi:MAG: hypothetical protein JW939_01250, partial [Candidatus Thermoplasmatota archaeon]|nr:hypothetical protein [Candidatus Thermoplasmatota archaeon]